MLLYVEALLYGLFSALALPLGALLGLWLKPSEQITARCMAFGAGALVFAVATQLYGESLFRLEASTHHKVDGHWEKECRSTCRAHYRNVNLMNIMGVVGAILYWALNRLLGRCMAGPAESSTGGPADGATASELSQRAPHGLATLATPTLSMERSLSGGGHPAQWVGISPIAARSHLRWGYSSRDLGDTLLRGMSAWEEESVPQVRVTEVQPAQVAEEGQGGGMANVAVSMWLGLMLDGIPESLMLGFMTNEKEVTSTFLLAIFAANFPEAFSGAAELQRSGLPLWKNFLMWFSVFAVTGILAMVGSAIMPDTVQAGSTVEKLRNVSTAIMEGLTGGAMLGMVATAMLPAAFQGAGEVAGICFVVGFVVTVFINAVGALFGT